MAQFEYIAIPVSLILTFGIARLLSGLPFLFMRRRTYWVHTLWCLQAIVNYAMFWWLFWSYHDVETWTLGRYLLVLLYPGMLYLGATIFVPVESGFYRTGIRPAHIRAEWCVAVEAEPSIAPV